MGQPITWQNVNQGDVSTAWRGLDSAQKSFNGAFEGLGGVLKEREAIDAGNMVVQNKNNTNAFLDQVTELGKTPEQLQKAIADGSLDKLRASFGPNIDHAATRNAGTDLLDQRFKQARTATEFNNFMLDEKTAPIMDKFKTAMLAGDKEGMEKYRSEYAASGGKHGVDLETFARNIGHENLSWDEEKKTWNRAQGTYDRQGVLQDATIENMRGTLRNAQAQTEISRGQLGVAQGSLKLQGKQLDMSIQDHLDAREAKAIEALGKARAADAATPEGTSAIFSSLESAFKGDDNGLANARRAFGDVLKQYPGISTAAAMSAVMTQDRSRWYKKDSIVRDGTVERAGEFAGTPEEILRQKAASVQRDAAINLYGRAHTDALNGPLGTKTSQVPIDPAATNAAKLAAAAKVAPVPEPVASADTVNSLALKSLEPAIAQTVKQIQAASDAGNKTEVARLMDIMAQQNAARAKAMGIK